MIKISVPARICFFGDHQDYLGLPVIAGAIDRFIHISTTPNDKAQFVIELKDLKKNVRVLLDDSLDQVNDGDYFRSAMAILKKYGLKLSQGYDVTIEGTIPVNAGLSSSSALTVAWIRFLLASQIFPFKPNNKEIGQWAYEAEVLYFDQPGGLMDQYSIAQGGLLFIDTQQGKSTRLGGDLGMLVVAESGLPKKTLDVLKNARIYAQNAVKAVREHHPEFDLDNAVVADYEKYKGNVPPEYLAHWYAAIHNYDITLKAKEELSKPKQDRLFLGDLMNRHQEILQDQIQNTPKEMVKMMQAAKKAGALGAKIIGSGGGGCMVALVEEETKDNVINAFMDSGAKAAYTVHLTSVD